jgi:PilZ domain-containing protein
MAVLSGRTQKRIAKAVVVELTHSESQPREKAVAQNVSSHGMRVATEHVWPPGDKVLLRSGEVGISTQARVVYCQHLGHQRFAIGLEFFEPVKNWSKSH